MKNTEMCASKAQYDTSIVQTLEALQPYARQWDELDRRSGLRLPLRSFVWFREYVRHRVREGESWFCVVVSSGKRIVGVLPVIHRMKSIAGIKQRIAYTPRDYYLRSADFIAAAEEHESVLPAALRAVSTYLDQLLYFQFKQIPRESPSWSLAHEGCGGFLTATQFDSRGSYFDVSQDADAFWAGLSKSSQRKLAKARRQLGREGHVETLEWVSAGKGREALEVFMKMEAAGWKGRTGSPVAHSESQTQLFRHIDHELRQRAELEWWFLMINHKPIAVRMIQRYRDVLVGIKTAYDESYARFSPGHLLLQDILSRALSDNSINYVDLLGDFPWHDNWGARKHSFHHVWFYPLRLRSCLLGWLPRKAYRLIRKKPVFSGCSRQKGKVG